MLVTGRTVAVGTDTAPEQGHDAVGASIGCRPSGARPAVRGWDGMSETAHHSGSETGGRPAWLLPVAIVAAVVVVAGIVVGVVLSQRSGKSGATGSPAAAATVVLPSPTPTVTAVARQATSAFAKALPSSVLQYALATSTADTAWQNAGALEAWDETYTDGTARTLKLRAGQWETADQAKAFAATLVAAVATPAPTASAVATPSAGASSTAAAGLPRSGDVTAGGATVGTYSVVDSGDGTATAVWTNGQSVFMLVAPAADAYAAYTAFPL